MKLKKLIKTYQNDPRYSAFIRCVPYDICRICASHIPITSAEYAVTGSIQSFQGDLGVNQWVLEDSLASFHVDEENKVIIGRIEWPEVSGECMCRDCREYQTSYYQCYRKSGEDWRAD